MVRGNWQKRVEVAAARRQESKQRKDRSEVKRQWKQNVQNFQASLDRIFDAIIVQLADDSEANKTGIWKLHLWADTIPHSVDDVSGDSLQIDLDEAEDNDLFGVTCDIECKQRKTRSKSLGDIHSVPDDKLCIRSRSRSNSTTVAAVLPSQGGKKKHPRSCTNNKYDVSLNDKLSANILGSNVNSSSNAICKSYFYTGNCDRVRSARGSGRKSDCCCRLIHGCCGSSGIEQHICLFHVLSNAKQPGGLQELSHLHDAERCYVTSDASELAFGAMDMLYFMNVELDLQQCFEQKKKPSDVFSEVISRMQLYLASIVYISVNSVLVFDRHRNGLVYGSDDTFMLALYPIASSSFASRRPRGPSVEGEHQLTLDKKASHNFTIVNFIPGTILAHILLFLPDSAIGAVSCVCQSWYSEIQSNPAIWKHMLNCRHWPVPEPHDFSETSGNDSSYRDDFCRHYCVLRDIKALQNGVDAILDPRSSSMNKKEMTYQSFSPKSQSQPPDACISIQNWSSNRILVAYNRDCTLRLFETQGEMQCKEIICQKIDPYRNTKKRTCRLLSMDLDDECIACLGSVFGCPGNPAEAFVLLVMSREDFLLADDIDTPAVSVGYSDDMTKVAVIDVGEAVLHYMISLDDGDHRLLELVDFLGHGGTIGDVEISASPTIISCGRGRCMIEVKISIPSISDFDDEDNFRLIDRKLFLFSSSAGAIIWSGESSPPSYALPPRHADMTISCLRRPFAQGCSRSSCFFAVRSPSSLVVLLGEIDNSGAVHCSSFSTSRPLAELKNVNSTNGGWEALLDGQYHVPMIVTPTDIVTADLLVRVDAGSDRISDRRTVISFQRRHFSRSPFHYGFSNNDTGFTLLGDLEVIRMSLIRDIYVVLICRMYQQPPFSDNPFLDVVYVVVIVHIPSRREICRSQFRNSDQIVDETIAPCISGDSCDTIGLSLSWEGVVMTGSDVRKTISEHPSRASHRKKSSLKKSSVMKKDGFSRGQQRM
jgi:F-box-like